MVPGTRVSSAGTQVQGVPLLPSATQLKQRHRDISSFSPSMGPDTQTRPREAPATRAPLVPGAALLASEAFRSHTKRGGHQVLPRKVGAGRAGAPAEPHAAASGTTSTQEAGAALTALPVSSCG